MLSTRKQRLWCIKTAAALLLCTVLLLSLFPQRALAKNGDIINNTNGLVSANVNDVCQTTDGFLWIAQYEGLTRYDGRFYQLINSVEIGGEEVRLEQITCVDNDEKNNLYIGTKDLGMVVYKNGAYSTVTEGWGSNVSDICVCNSRVYVATADGAYVYDQGEVTRISESAVLSVTADDTAVYYAAQDGAVYRCGDTTELFYNEKPVKIVRVLDGKLYMGSRFGTLICAENGAFTEYPVSKDDPINALYIQDGVLILGTDKGVFMLNGARVERIKELKKYSGINHVIFDFEGGMWLATTVGLVELHRFGVKNLFLSYDLPEALTNACFEYKDRLYVGTNDGVVIIDEKNDCTVSNTLTQMMRGIRIRDFAELNGELYVATYSAKEFGVVAFDGRNIRNISAEEMLNDPNAENADAQGQIRCFACLGDDLLIGTNNGITLLRDGQYKTTIMEHRPLSITVGQNQIYVCTDGDGIHTLDFDLNITGVVEDTKGKTILRAIEYGDGLLYTAGTALCFAKNGTQTLIRTQNIGSIVDLIEMPAQLAILTGSGMMLVDKSTLLDEKVKVDKKLTSVNGLESGVTANGRACYLPQSGTMYLNCQSGVYKYSETPANRDVAVPRLAINGITVDGEAVPIQNTVYLRKNAGRVEIDLSVLTFLERDNLTLHYQMDGVDKAPLEQNFDRKSSIEYMNLRGGRYVLRIHAENADGICSDEMKIYIDKENRWIEKPANLMLTIVTAMVVLISLMGLVFRSRVLMAQKRTAWSKRITEESLEAVAGAIDAKDNDTNGHSIRVAKLAECIGKHLNMSEDELEFLYYTGLMHDVGKIGIPDRILNKPGRLSDEEFAFMQKHPEIGCSILKPIHSIPHLEDGVLYHHERYDGMGYPNHLKGNEIPLTGKIIACADVYDALASQRCYKKGMSDEEIIAEFEDGKGTHFDPAIARIAIECIKSGEFNAILMKWHPKAQGGEDVPEEE